MASSAEVESSMQVAHLLRKYNPLEWGGTETAVKRLLDGLRSNGVASKVFCPDLERPPLHDPLGIPMSVQECCLLHLHT